VTGAQLKEIRRQLQLTQQDLATRVGRSQKVVSMWENDRVGIPADVIEVLNHELRQKLPNVSRQPGQAGPQESKVFSWPVGLFELLWNDAPKRARHVTLEAALEPSRSHPSFADVTITITFEELEVPEGQRLYLDHLGIVGSPLTLEKVEAKRAKVVQDFTVSQIKDPEGKVGSSHVVLGPHVVAYEISEADSLDRVVITLRAQRGVSRESMDGVIFPLYADLLVEKLTIKASFKGLQPHPDPIIPRAFLIRRSAHRLHGLLKHFEMPAREQTVEGVRYTLGPLMRLRGGYLYGLAWERLDLAPQGEDAER
jgi:transcriptional regulator with XRE-family HTH domain